MRTVCLAALVWAASASADDPKPPPPAERLAALKKEVEDADAAFRKAYAALKNPNEDNPEVEKLYQAFTKAQEGNLQKAYDLAKADPKSASAFDALEWMLTVPRTYYLPPGIPALELAAEHYAADPRVGKIVAWVGYYTPHEKFNAKEHKAALTLIQAVAEKNPDRTARGQAVMALAWQAKGRFTAAEHGKTSDVEKLAAEAEAQFEAIRKDYADCRRLMRPGMGTLGEEADRELFELRHLRVGKAAPDIEGEDLDGVRFKLSDYRGKVVVLDFWGDW